MKRIIDWSPHFGKDYADLTIFSGGETLWHNDIQIALHAFTSHVLSTDQQLGAIQKAQRLLGVHHAGLGNDPALYARLSEPDVVNWDNFSSPPVADTLQHNLAAQLDICTDKNQTLVKLGDENRIVGVALVERLLSRDVPIYVSIVDQNAHSLIVNATTQDGLVNFGKWHIAHNSNDVKVHIYSGHNMPTWPHVTEDSVKKKYLASLAKPFNDRRTSGDVRWILTRIPTRKDAEIDGIPYGDYADLFFRMCDQPWPHITKAHDVLIALLDKTNHLRFTNNDGTDLSMRIDGFTFCNSTIVRNIPGSEVFSAPQRDSVNGIIVARGKFADKHETGAVMENLRLVFENGYLTEATAEKGQKLLDDAIGTDEGARWVGEIGIGTNPYLKQHVASILLSEKIGGSFHVALGEAYSMTDYLGTPVTVDNGNRSNLHWDITTMLHGKQGKIYADGNLIMDDGIFLDPQLAVLNLGWGAIPEH